MRMRSALCTSPRRSSKNAAPSCNARRQQRRRKRHSLRARFAWQQQEQVTPSKAWLVLRCSSLEPKAPDAYLHTELQAVLQALVHTIRVVALQVRQHCKRNSGASAVPRARHEYTDVPSLLQRPANNQQQVTVIHHQWCASLTSVVCSPDCGSY